MALPTGTLIEKEQRQQFWRRLFRRVFLEDWGTKLIALGISLALWLGVTGLRAPTTVRLKNITLNARASNDMEITNSPVQEVDIVVTGDKRLLDRLNTRDLIVSADLTDVKPGDRVIQLTPDTVRIELPNGLKLDEIQPSKIAIHLEKVEEREIDVKPDIEGSLAEGLEVYDVVVVPARVRVRGAESFIKSLDSISTEPVNLGDRKESFVASQVGLNVVNPKITLLDAIVDVNVRVGEKRIERIFTVPIKTEVESESKRASVVLYGARSAVEKLRAEDMHVEIQSIGTNEPIPRLVMPGEFQDKVEVRKIRLPS